MQMRYKLHVVFIFICKYIIRVQCVHLIKISDGEKKGFFMTISEDNFVKYSYRNNCTRITLNRFYSARDVSLYLHYNNFTYI